MRKFKTLVRKPLNKRRRQEKTGVYQIIKTFLYLHTLGFLNYQRKMDELILELDCLRSKYIHMQISAKAIKL